MRRSCFLFLFIRVSLAPCALIILLSATAVSSQNVSWQKTNSALIRMGDDQPQKTPLILIHGINGTKVCDEKATLNSYWNKFRLLFGKDTELQTGYTLYIFQYCSNVAEVSKIALELRDLIDDNLTDRNHVILAHSMGGLVAKSYMVETVHLKGSWARKTGGETTLEIITLATPHHGTPGANLPKTLERHFARGWRNIYEEANYIYWREDYKDPPPFVSDSTLPNRSDLRWDNYDFNLDVFKDDLNEKLLNRNLLFQRYTSKLIAYSGYLETSTSNTIAKVLGEILKYKNITIEVSEEEKYHRRLSLANAALFYGLGKDFGNTDGLVPFKSGLLCDNEQVISSPNTVFPPKPKNYICKSPSRVRRFESGAEGLVLKTEYPDANTLSIYKNPHGFDHLDMLEDRIVLGYVARDLKDLINSQIPTTTTLPLTSKIPTLFLFDVSGSMSENGKIGQARDAGLDALKEMRENAGPPSPVSIMTFSGDICGGKVTQKILNFTGNLAEAENTMRLRLPVPNGGTPLPQAKDAAYNDLLGYLDANGSFPEGRIVLLSDGQSTCGAIRPPNVYSIRRTDILISRLGSSRIRFLTIGFDVPPGSAAERDLQYLASESGGKYYNAADRKQLIRAFQKQLRRFLPRSCNSASADMTAGMRAFAELDYPAALEAFRRYSAANPGDWCGAYNLALAYEANDRYKKAADTYQLYLRNVPNAPDRVKIEQRIVQLRQDYLDQLDYYAGLMQSDVDYLKRYYQSVFNRSSSDLAEEFSGFVYEKRDFYANLPEILEIDARWLSNDAKDISSSIDVLVKRRKLATFDRDAVSLLTTPISLIEELAGRLRDFRANSAQ
jgi:Mg-chelatase subunit ChlD